MRGIATRQRTALVGLLAVVTAIAAVTPGLNAPFARLAAYDADGPDPITTVAVDVEALRRAAAILPDDTRYALLVEDTTQGQTQHDVEGVARLFFLPALAVRDAGDADWILRYGNAVLPAGVRPAAKWRVGDGVVLLHIR